MALELGGTPHSLRVVIAAGGGWAATLENTLGPWREGVTIALVMTDRRGGAWTWPATLDGAYAHWRKTELEAATVTAGAEAKLIYTEPGTAPVVWFDGGVILR